MEILVAKQKHTILYIDATDKQAALKYLFEFNDKINHFYDWLEHSEDDPTAYHELKLLKRARQGDNRAIRELLVEHNGNEYESWDFEDIIDPIKDKIK